MCLVWQIWDKFERILPPRLSFNHVSCLNHVSGSCVTWPIYVWRDSFMCDVTHLCVTWLIYVWRDSFMCDMTHLCVTHTFFWLWMFYETITSRNPVQHICVVWFIHIFGLCVLNNHHVLKLCVIWLSIILCDMILSSCDPSLFGELGMIHSLDHRCCLTWFFDLWPKFLLCSWLILFVARFWFILRMTQISFIFMTHSICGTILILFVAQFWNLGHT